MYSSQDSFGCVEPSARCEACREHDSTALPTRRGQISSNFTCSLLFWNRRCRSRPSSSLRRIRHCQMHASRQDSAPSISQRKLYPEKWERVAFPFSGDRELPMAIRFAPRKVRMRQYVKEIISPRRRKEQKSRSQGWRVRPSFLSTMPLQEAHR